MNKDKFVGKKVRAVYAARPEYARYSDTKIEGPFVSHSGVCTDICDLGVELGNVAFIPWTAITTFFVLNSAPERGGLSLPDTPQRQGW